MLNWPFTDNRAPPIPQRAASVESQSTYSPSRLLGTIGPSGPPKASTLESGKMGIGPLPHPNPIPATYDGDEHSRNQPTSSDALDAAEVPDHQLRCYRCNSKRFKGIWRREAQADHGFSPFG